MHNFAGRFAKSFRDIFAIKFTGEMSGGTDWKANNYDNIGAGYNITLSDQGDARSKFHLSYRSLDAEYPERSTTEGEAVEVFEGEIDTVSNFSIPGIRSYQVHSYDSLMYNKFYDRFDEQVSEQSLIETIIAKNPSLVLLSLGTGDVYPYIINGASGHVNPPYNNISANDATPLPLFEQSVKVAINEILDNTEADIVLPTIIDPVDFFYFNTLKYYYPIEEISDLIPTLVSHYKSFNEDVQEFNARSDSKSRPPITFDLSGGYQFRAKVFIDDLLPYAEADDGTDIPRYRQITREEYLLYNAEKKQFNSINSDKTFATTVPAKDKYVITVEEYELIRNLINDYNNVLRSIAENKKRVKLLDLYMVTEDLKKGIVSYDGVFFNVGFGQNTVVSADGYTLNGKGHALLANEFVKLLNSTYGTNLAPFDVNNYRGNTVKNGFNQ